MSGTAFCFDLDGTVTRRELLPIIAAEAGIAEEMALLTSLTLSGTVPFEMSFRLRVQLLKSIAVSRVADIVAEVPVDEAIASFIRERPQDCFVVTGNLDVWVAALVARLGCRAFTSRALTEGDRLVQVASVLRKSQAIAEIRDDFERIVVIGESVNDIPMFEQGDIRIAFGGVHAPVADLVAISDYVTFDGTSLCRFLSRL